MSNPAEQPLHAGSPPSAPDISPIRRLIAQVRRLLRSSWVATGLGITLALLFGVLVAAALLDLVMPLPVPLRLLALLAVVIPAAIACWSGVIRPLFRRMSPVRVARVIEPHLPKIHNRLVSVVDLDQPQAREKFSGAFHQRLVRETLERIKSFAPSRVINFQTLRRAAVAALLAVGAFAGAFALFSDRLPTAVARIFQPFADIPPATGVTFDVEPKNTKSLRGDPIELAARVTKGEPEGLRAEVRLLTSGQTIWHDLEAPRAAANAPATGAGPVADGDEETEGAATAAGPRHSITLAGIDESFEYRIHGGGTWSPKYRVEMLDRPRIVDVQSALHYPQYMGIAEPRVNPPLQLDVTGPEESQVEVRVATAGDVSEGQIELLDARVQQVEVAERVERVWFAEALPDGANPEGVWEWDLRLLARPAHTDPAAAGLHRHLFQNVHKPFALKAGESLFAMVYVVPGQVPETIMLEWTDGAGWDHRAVWGEDKIGWGKPGTASRHMMGPIPPAGEWTRLEVPAAAVDLEQKSLRGMAFTLFGGQCVWHRAGALPAQFREERELVVKSTLPLGQIGSDEWGGRFPLVGTGFYRVALKNELGHGSPTMQEGRYVGIPDAPPQIVIDRPGQELLLSHPVKVPVSVSVYDDFGLAKVVLSLQKPGEAGFESRPIVRYSQPAQTDQFLHSLDLPAWDLKPGDAVRFRLEVHDRKEQSRSSPEFVIRIQDSPQAADKQLDAFQKQQETLQQKFDKLVEEQGRVEEKLKTLEERKEQLTEKLEQAQKEADKQAAETAAAAGENAPKPEPQPLPLDPATTQELAEVRQELAQAAQQEAQNVQASEQISKELQQLAEAATKLDLLPQPIVQELQDLPGQMQAQATEPLKALQSELQQGADAKQAPPDLPGLAEAAEMAQENLENLQQQLQAVAKATDQARQDAQKGIDQLREARLTQEARKANQDLNRLQEFIKDLRADLQRLEETEGALQQAADTVPEMLLPDVEKRQGALETEADPKLAQARELLANPGQLPEQAGKPDMGDPAGDNPAGENPAGETPTGENPQGKPQPAPFQPALKAPPAKPQPTPGKPAPAGDKPAGDNPQGNNPPADNPQGDNPAGENPQGDNPAGDNPAGDNPQGDNPQGDNPAGDNPPGKTPPGKTPPGKTPPGKTPPGKTPPGKTPPAKPQDTPAGAQQRQDLAERQDLKMAELQAAERSLAADAQTLERIMNELAEAAGLPVNPPGEEAANSPMGEPGPGEPGQAPDGAGEMPAGQPQGAGQPPRGTPPGQQPGKPPAGDMPPGGQPAGDPAQSPAGQPPGQAPGQQPGKPTGQQPGQAGGQPEAEPAGSEPNEGTPTDAPPAVDARELAELLNSEAVREARAMAARLQQARQAAELAQPGQTPQQSQPANPSAGPSSTTAALPPSAAHLDVALQGLDLETRTILLKMQPKLREELLQGLREEGPQGYQKFIRNYYQRLARVKGEKAAKK